MTHPAYQLDWNLVRTFVAVVDSGSLAAAARRMGLSHPTVARHVQLLEQNLGVDLFDRTSSGLSINEAGTRLAEAASRMQRDAIAFEAVSDTVKTSTVGTARITVAEILAELFPALLSPLQQFPTSERMIELVISNQSLNLLERECDIAIRHVRPVQTELICRKVGSLSFAAWASAGYLADVGEPTLETLARHWFIDGISDSRFTEAMEKFGYEIPKERVMFRTDSVLAQRQAAQAGWGIAGLPLYLAEATPGLCKVLETEPVHELEVWVVARPQVRHTLLLKQVFDHVAAALHEFLNAPAKPATSPVVVLN